MNTFFISENPDKWTLLSEETVNAHLMWVSLTTMTTKLYRVCVQSVWRRLHTSEKTAFVSKKIVWFSKSVDTRIFDADRYCTAHNLWNCLKPKHLLWHSGRYWKTVDQSCHWCGVIAIWEEASQFLPVVIFGNLQKEFVWFEIWMNSQFSRYPLTKYPENLCFKGTRQQVVQDAMEAQMRTYGCGSRTLSVLVELWLREALKLQAMVCSIKHWQFLWLAMSSRCFTGWRVCAVFLTGCPCTRYLDWFWRTDERNQQIGPELGLCCWFGSREPFASSFLRNELFFCARNDWKNWQPTGGNKTFWFTLWSPCDLSIGSEASQDPRLSPRRQGSGWEHRGWVRRVFREHKVPGKGKTKFNHECDKFCFQRGHFK